MVGSRLVGEAWGCGGPGCPFDWVDCLARAQRQCPSDPWTLSRTQAEEKALRKQLRVQLLHCLREQHGGANCPPARLALIAATVNQSDALKRRGKLHARELADLEEAVSRAILIAGA